MGFFEEGDYSFVESFASGIKDFGEASPGGREGVAEFEEGFGDGAGLGAGEANDADAAAAGWGGDGDDGVVVFGHFLMVIAEIFFGLVFGGGRGVFTGENAISTVFLGGVLLVGSAFLWS